MWMFAVLLSKMQGEKMRDDELSTFVFSPQDVRLFPTRILCHDHVGLSNSSPAA